ncbi:MAG TPA: PEP-CTERM sorting domain-containing protein [Chthoniobacterales bacterium]|nr:PEP-CTERM sorting domain-containing protein [Chthoniobacterales bacterium]
MTAVYNRSVMQSQLLRLSLIAVLTCALVSIGDKAAAQEVSIYGMFKSVKSNQTDVGTFSAATNPNRFSTFVVPTSNGSVTAASVTLPSGSTATSPQALSNANDGTGNFIFQAKFPDQATLDSNYADGTYHMQITGASSTVYTANNLVLTGGVYPSTTPTITNTNWSNGSLQVDPSASFTLNWGAFSGAAGTDRIVLTLQNTTTGQSVFLQFLSSSTTSETFGAGFFQPNQNYQGSIDFLKVATFDTTDISGATGIAAYARETGFSIQTVPEPSTVAMIFLGAGFAGIAALGSRRRGLRD